MLAKNLCNNVLSLPLGWYAYIRVDDNLCEYLSTVRKQTLMLGVKGERFHQLCTSNRRRRFVRRTMGTRTPNRDRTEGRKRLDLPLSSKVPKIKRSLALSNPILNKRRSLNPPSGVEAKRPWLGCQSPVLRRCPPSASVKVRTSHARSRD